MRNGARTHFAIVLNQSVVGDLPAGPVTEQDVAGVVGEDEALVRLTVTGRLLRDVLEHIVSGEIPIANVAGLELWYDPERERGRRVREVRFPDGRDVERDQTYTLAMTSSAAAGNAGFTMISDAGREETGISRLQALLSYLPRLRQPVEPPWSERIHSTR
jgi:2',3'-cyclic-nucleotide 2'-phosphodiesterase (5'-nucleotidase family)